MAHRVSRYESGHERSAGIFGGTVNYSFEVIEVVADTYSELIAAIDEIPDADLTWYSQSGNLGIEGMPTKIKGKWVAQLMTPEVEEERT